MVLSILIGRHFGGRFAIAYYHLKLKQGHDCRYAKSPSSSSVEPTLAPDTGQGQLRTQRLGSLSRQPRRDTGSNLPGWARAYFGSPSVGGSAEPSFPHLATISANRLGIKHNYAHESANNQCIIYRSRTPCVGSHLSGAPERNPRQTCT